MLKSLKVEKLVISAIPDLVETWTIGFGFQLLEEDERQSLSKISLMVFPGSVWLKKLLYTNCNMDERNGELSCTNFDDYFTVISYLFSQETTQILIAPYPD